MKTLLPGIVSVVLALLLIATACSAPTATPAPAATPTLAPPTATVASTAPSAAPTATPTPVAQATMAPTPVPSAGEFNVGASLPLTGVGSPWGIGTRDTLDMARDAVNNAGGIVVAGQTYMIKLIIYDDQYQASGGTANTNRLVFTDGVKYMIQFGGGLIPAEQTITEPNKVILFALAYGTSVLDAEYPYTFRLCTSSEQFVHTLLPWIKQNYPNVKTFATLGSNTSSITSLLQYDQQEGTKLGWKDVSDDLEPATATDFAPAATKILGANPDYVAIEGSPAPLGLMMKALHDAGFTGVTSSLTGVDVVTMLTVASPSAIEGLVTAMPDWTSSVVPKAANDYYAAYMAKYGPPIEIIAAESSPVFEILKTAIEQAGTFDTTAVKQVMESPNFTFDTPYGPATFGSCGGLLANGHQAQTPLFVSVVKNGKLDTVLKVTPNWATFLNQ